MASADLRKELECSVCLNIYTDPVMLKCGHNFCRDCIGRVLDTQEMSGGYFCPECREEFQDRPALHRNITLRNIEENFLSTHPDQEESGVFCTYCIHTPVPAVISCLLCEASLCDNHLRVHSKSPEHVLCDPTTSLENRKCSIHKKILEYYCTEDSTCICVSCSLAGEHRGHQVETLDEASEMKKKKLRNVLQKLMTEREKMEKRVQSLQEHRRKVQGEADDETERVTVLFRDLRRRLEDLEKRVLREISGQAERISGIINDLVRDLEIKKEDLSRKMGDIEELCNMTDPLTVLQESDTGDLCDTEDGDDEDRERHDKLLHDGGDLDVGGISHTLHTGLSDIMSGVNVERGVTDILLDVRTAGNNLHISDDRKTASKSSHQNRPETPERFRCSQVMSSQRFSSGRHYWEVDVRRAEYWIVGMCYPSIDRRGGQSGIGWNKKSWCLERGRLLGNQYSVIHDRYKTPLPGGVSSGRVRIDLDYEAGRISFYDLCDPIRHLHTFTTTFTEPLHAGVCVGGGCINICGGNQKVRRSPLMCPIFFKVETFLCTHLRRVCMNEAPDEEIKAAISGARDKLFKSAKCCAVPSRQLEEQFNPEILEDIAKFLEDRGLTVINKPSLTRIQYTNWTSKTRLHMRKGGLYERHSLKAPMLKEFATYLHETLVMENYKQEVEDVVRFLYFMNPKRVNLHFVKDIGKVNTFISLKRHLKNRTISGYLKHECTELVIMSVRYFQFHFSLLLSAMASADLRKELECSVCLNIYTDPVTLKCGHNFCRDCIGRVWDTQEGSGGYSCPECREEFQDRPALHRNITLRNIVENFLSTHPDREESGVFCTYCIHTPVPAVISCLHCEASLCDNHLRVHSKSPEHVLCDLTTSLENRKCSVHKKILEYYCTEDSTSICVSCRLDGEHRGHQVETLDEASEMKKKKLRNVLQKLMTEREEMEKRVQSLQEHRRKVQGEADDETERVTVLFRDLRRRLEDLEKRVLREISGQAERISGIINDLVQDLEIKKEDLSRKMGDIEELCNMTDPLTVLQESDTGDLCDTEDGDDEDRERHDKLLHDGGDLDVGGISHTLHTGLSDIMSQVNVERGVTDILLDVRTAGNYLHISDDRKSVSESSSPQNRPETPERFQDYQVMSSQRFSSGRHYWEVDVGGSGWWRVGMCYPSIERRGDQSRIGWNKKSWCLQRWDNQYSVRHDSNKTPLPGDVSSRRVRIDLDYEAGRISFYDLCDPIRHLHTFTTTFTEPLHAGVYVGGGWGGCIKICGGNRK
ncbi:uncharacterized protein [Aquarana catesbeiana]|uniref:uncharacterized protein n=1 Tax=Aquarana catesbeiana TaxID=8400 RepID=UPI003CC98493